MTEWQSSLKSLIHVRDLIGVLILRDLRLRYKRSVLGIAWSLLNPLLQLLVFYFVFQFVIPVRTENFATFLFIGLLAWNWFQTSLQFGCGAIIDHASLVRQPGFTVAVLPLVTVLSSLLHFLIALVIVIPALLLAGKWLSITLLALPLVILVQGIITLSLVYALAAVHVRFRDTQYLVGAFLLLGFYLSPVLYSAVAVPEQVRWAYNLNPLVPVIEGYRSILIAREWPDLRWLSVVGVAGFSMLWAGYTVFVRASRSFVEEIGA